jgi:ligand-binding sensor domain-containing protein/signal transduction histidine kinase
VRYALNQLGRLLAGVVVVCFFKDASALDPNRMSSQYVREQWITEGDSPGGRVRAIAQTSDGYLWIGTDFGLVRFDGFNFRPVPFSSSVSIFENAPVLGLTIGADGNLLVRLQGAGVLRQNEGKFETVAAGLSETASHVTAMWSEPDGGVLLSDLISGMLRLRGERLEVLARSGVVPRSLLAISLAETPDGKIWMGTLGAGLSYLAQGRVTSLSSGLAYRKINCLLPVSANELWVGTDDGLLRWDGTALNRPAMPPLLDHVQVLTLLRDRDSNLWVGTAIGLLRINAAGISTLDEKDLRGDGGINALFEDREGNIWVGGARGVERIRDSAFVTYSPEVGLPSEHSGPIYADSENNIWFSPIEGGLYRLRNGQAEAIRVAGLDKDVVYSITGHKGEIWVGRRRGGLTRLRYEQGSVASQTYTEANGLAQNSVYAVYQSRDGALWAGTVNAGVNRLKDGRFVTYTTASGLSSNTVYSIAEAPQGTIWVATPSGLNAWSGDHWRTYTSRAGLPSDDVKCLFEDSSGVLWIGTSEGLASIRSGHIQVFRDAPDSLHTQILGLTEDKKGWLWIATSNHVLQVRRDKLSAGAVQEGDVREYGLADGLRSTEGLNRNDTVITDRMGRIWFSMSRGLSVVDPSQLINDSPPAIVHLEGISADGNPINLGSSIRIPPSHKRITFSYTGLSLAQPERIRFRYFVDGFDRDWSGPVAGREAVYTNLGPGSYKFRLISSNSNGIWNGSESTILFQVEPALWQTWWFRSACLLAAGLLMLFIYRLRLHRLKHQMNVRFEERLAERTRIAQDLHDTLLQGFLSASMQLHVANDQIPEEWPAKPIVSRVLELMGNVINDGRNAVRGLRSSNAESDGLEQALSRIPQEFVLQQSIDFRVIVEGQPRPLHPIIRDEVYRIGREALANAFRHSRATGIEVEVEYGDSQLRILVRDNGCGIDEEVLRSGRDGHWGLSGIRERAERIGAKIKVWSRPAGGTEVELSVPGYVAFLHYSSSRGPRWFSRLHPHSSEQENQKQGSGREK